MDVTIFILTLVACGISVGCAALSAWFARGNAVHEVRNDVDEIISVVDKIARESRSAKMRRVRGAAEETDILKPPGLVENPPFSPVTKADLRRMINRGNPQ